MSPNDRNKLNRIEELKSKLFSKNYNTRMEHWGNFPHPKGADVPDSWEDSDSSGSDTLNPQEKFFMKTSRFKKFFIFSIVFFGLTIGYAAYVFFFSNNSVSNNNIDISILGNAFTAGGDDFSMVIGITNRNNLALDLVDLVVEYPKGDATDLSSNTEHFRESLGTIPAGTVRNENVKIVLYGEQGAVRPIKVSIEYRVAGSNAIFVKDKPYQVTISSTPVNFVIDAPEIASPNQNITLNVKSVLNSNKVLSNVLFKIDYPVGFQFISANPAPSVGNNVWNMGDLTPGIDRNISITGKMIDVFDGDAKSFRITSGSASQSNTSTIAVVYNSFLQTILIKRPFIEANIAINGSTQAQYTNDSKNVIRGTINWSNNLDTKVGDIEIRAKISGNAYNTKTVSGEQGNYDALQNSIIWNKFSASQLSEANPGDSGILNFTISPISLVSATNGILSNPSINIEVSISGKQLIEGYVPKQLDNSESKVIRITSDVGLSGKALYYSGPFTNTGPIPPKVEKETTYTITWSISNTSNNLSKGQVKAVLPSWVRFMGTISPATEDLTYNTFSREMIWNVGRIPKGTGITSIGKKVSFQIGFTPLFSQIKTVPIIINETILTAHDDFANVDVKVSEAALYTQLNSDTAFPIEGSLVTE